MMVNVSLQNPASIHVSLNTTKEIVCKGLVKIHTVYSHEN